MMTTRRTITIKIITMTIMIRAAIMSGMTIGEGGTA